MQQQIGNLTFVPFIERARIQERVRDLAARISRDYAGKDPLFLGLLNGAFMFLGDLAKEITVPAHFSFVKYSSYAHTQSTGKVRELIGLGQELRGRHIVVVEDIVDTGLTMQHLLRDLAAFEPASVAVASLLLKPEALQCELHIAYLGFEIPNAFVVGYGLDYNEYGRNLADIYVLQE
jgi:hypoxanthine phosphoribosyltransferase